MRVVAIDPGETTGIAVYDDVFSDANRLRWEAVSGQMGIVSRIRTELAYDVSVLVIEEFRISTGTAKKSRSGTNTAIEIIGAAKWLAHCSDIAWVEQAPSDVMGFMTNEKLRRIGWYVPNEHARDAVRHLAFYLIKSGALPAESVLAG